MNRISKIAIASSVAAFAAVGALRPDRLIAIASGAVSQNVCSGVFLSGLEPDVVYFEEMRPEGGMGLIAWALTYDVDRVRRRVTTTVLGAFESASSFHDGYGCRLEHPGAAPLEPAIAVSDSPTVAPPDIAGSDLVSAQSPALDQALENAFRDVDHGHPRATRAVVVVHDGRVVAERYAPGIDVHAPLLSHSVAKSVMNALVGILVRDGKLTIDQDVAALAWHSPPRVDHLLRMNSGLPLDEPGPAYRMWFVERDGAAFATRMSLEGDPGTRWQYSNAGFAVLSRLVRDAVGGTAASVAAFAKRELFAPLGMRTATIEFDGAGSPMGSNAVLASARDWARFGLLYLNDGIVGDRRILPEGWVAYSRSRTLDSGYGAGFWLNVTDAPVPSWGYPWGLPGAPKDTFMARGYLGQYVVVIPSRKLVVVRFGVTRAPGVGMDGVGQLVREVIDALDRS